MWVNLVILKQLPLQSEADISEKHASPAKQSVFVSHILSHVFFTPLSEVPQKLYEGVGDGGSIPPFDSPI